jgi:hypothetical protein
MAGDGLGDPADWLADYAGRVTELLEDAGRVNAQLAKHWGARALDDADEWTIDTVTADVIEAWEHLTPLADRGLELWLELLQQGLRPKDTA